MAIQDKSDDPNFGHCQTCDQYFDLREMHFINYDEEPIALDIQLKDCHSREEAREFMSFGIDFEDDDEGPYHYDAANRLSHMEAGDDDHTLKIHPMGYWGVE